MVRQLPTPIRGATHVEVEEVSLNIVAQAIFVRGTLGTSSAGIFTPDAALRKVEHAFKGAQALSLAQAMGVNALWSALDSANWGFS